ncbi:hypothetical protein GCAAIG_06860 [Candidatus Electronema halotolerans]
MELSEYHLDGFYDELFAGPDQPHPGAKLLIEKIESLSQDDLLAKQQAAEIMLLQMGITFAVYGNEEGAEKIFPFDTVVSG